MKNNKYWYSVWHLLCLFRLSRSYVTFTQLKAYQGQRQLTIGFAEKETSVTDDLETMDEQGDLLSDCTRSFQSLLSSRNTASNFVVTEREIKEKAHELKDALSRATACGIMAPNHKLTEPWSFLRLLSPSPGCSKLADITYHVHLSKSIQLAEAKRKMWQQVPAFLVVLAHENHQPILRHTVDDPYAPLPYIPPETEAQLEDVSRGCNYGFFFNQILLTFKNLKCCQYAAACAAVQNILLSLHAEDIGTKWVTGPVIRTQAFRDLIRAQPTDRIVALILVGEIGSATAKTEEDARRASVRRRRRKSLPDVLIDM